MTKERMKEIIKQVIHNPQVTPPAISYKITDVEHNGGGYSSEYIDIGDFKRYVKDLEDQLLNRINQ